VLVSLRGVALGYGRGTVLAGVDWDVRTGERWFLLGPNGAGKTTLLRAVLGLPTPARGVVARDPALAGRERIGFVPQRCEMNPAVPTTVREFVTLGLVGQTVEAPEREARLTAALAEAGLAGLAARSYWSLSGGQRQRALVARALVRRPSLLVLDEPTEGLDVASEDAFLDALVASHAATTHTLLFVTHRLAIAARLATHVAIAAQGRFVAASRDEALASPLARESLGQALGRLATEARA
jgi:zinc transport system ATP-binding protein